MTDNDYNVKVAKDLQDLIPTFLSNRRKEVEALRAALAAADFDQLRQLGHRMRGVGSSYGFARVSSIGRNIEDGARGGDKALLETSISAYAEYLSKVQVAYE